MTQPKEIIRSNRKTIALIVNNRAELIVKAPFDVSDEKIANTICRKQNWIDEKQKFIMTFFGKYHESTFEVGESFLYKGNYYMLDYNSDVVAVTIEDKNIILPINKKEIAGQLLREWYKSQAIQDIRERVDFWANKIGVKYTSFNLSEAKGRWGSCGINQNINLNWRLIMCPQFVVDYVIIHELSHIKFKNHSKYFWNRVATIMPDYKSAQDWLSQNSGLITIL